MNESIHVAIRRVLRDHARLAVDADAIAADADLFQAGMSSYASVNVMLALEDHFDIEFPNHLLTPAVFQSVSSIEAAVGDLLPKATI
jgi:acyl carrier protein